MDAYSIALDTINRMGDIYDKCKAAYGSDIIMNQYISNTLDDICKIFECQTSHTKECVLLNYDGNTFILNISPIKKRIHLTANIKNKYINEIYYINTHNNIVVVLNRLIELITPYVNIERSYFAIPDSISVIYNLLKYSDFRLTNSRDTFDVLKYIFTTLFEVECITLNENCCVIIDEIISMSKISNDVIEITCFRNNTNNKIIISITNDYESLLYVLEQIIKIYS